MSMAEKCLQLSKSSKEQKQSVRKVNSMIVKSLRIRDWVMNTSKAQVKDSKGQSTLIQYRRKQSHV